MLLLCNFRLDFLPSENYPSDLFAVFCIRKENLSSVFKANSRVWERKPLGAEVLVSRELFHRNAMQQHWWLEAEPTTSFQSCCISGRETTERRQDEFVSVSQYPPAPQCRLHNFLRESRIPTVSNCVYSTSPGIEPGSRLFPWFYLWKCYKSKAMIFWCLFWNLSDMVYVLYYI